MFAIMFETEGGKAIRTFEKLEDAQYKAQDIACMGYSVTVFDYDMESKQFMEFYTI